MNLDRTLCTNLTCPLKAKCDRHADRLTEFKKANPKAWTKPYISMSEFKPDAKGECSHYDPPYIDNKKK